MSAAPDIFLSYNREDAAIAKAYADAFAREGLEVWWDATLKSGEAYDEVTEAALHGAKAVVVLWSPRSVGSRWVRAEATVADRNKTFMPVTIEPCTRPVMFELTQTADLSHWRGEASDPAWQTFLGDVRRFAGYGDAERSAATRPSPPSSAGAGAPATVAVIPLTHRPDNEETQILAEDLTEDITRELARHQWFQVVAAATMAAWRRQRVDYAAISRETMANYLISGNLRRSGSSLRLTFQIIDAESANVVSSFQIEWDCDASSAVPEELPLTIASELGEQVWAIELKRCVTKPGPLTGWEHLFRASRMAGSGPDGMASAIEEARKAVLLAPDLGMAHSMLAAILSSDSLSGREVLDEASRREIQVHIKRALLLDGDNPAILAGLVNAHVRLGDLEAGLRLARRGVEIDPRSSESLFALGRACHLAGRTAEAIEAFQSQLSLAHANINAGTGMNLLGLCLCIEGRLGEAEAAADSSLTLNPHLPTALSLKAVLAALQGREREAHGTIARLREAEPGFTASQHLRSITNHPPLLERAQEYVATFGRLWAETGGDP